ncbi:MAG: hypothetical protein FJ388_18995, partial [Verrucomicrobia bacterium]|nr:hypothetical protein [Verrucomicrobiota bacterium]
MAKKCSAKVKESSAPYPAPPSDPVAAVCDRRQGTAVSNRRSDEDHDDRRSQTAATGGPGAVAAVCDRRQGTAVSNRRSDEDHDDRRSQTAAT